MLVPRMPRFSENLPDYYEYHTISAQNMQHGFFRMSGGTARPCGAVMCRFLPGYDGQAPQNIL